MNKKNQVLLALIMIIAILLRINYMDINRTFSSPDESVYHYAAENIIKYSTFTMDRDGAMFRGEAPVVPADNLQVGYPLFITLIYLVFGSSPQYVYVTQFILSILDLVFMFFIMRSLNLHSKSILIAMAIAAVYPGFIFNIDRMLTEQLFKTLLLLFVFMLIKGLHTNKNCFFICAALFGGYATLVRGLALPMCLLALIVIIIYGKTENKFKRSVTFIIAYLCTQIWWWVRNYITFKRFILLSSAGDNPKIWGMMPYYMDMTSSVGKSLSELFEWALSIDIVSFFQWRIFGMFQYMWGDIWDENLVHPGILYHFLFLQIVIVLSIVLIPKLLKFAKGEELLILSFPAMFTIMNLPYHGLPRYVYPAIPFIIIIFAMLLDDIKTKKTELDFDQKWKKRADYIIKSLAFVVTSCFSLVLLYSLLFFSWNINKEMSNWRIDRHYDVSLNEISEENKIYSNNEIINICNSIPLTEGKYKIIPEAYPLIYVSTACTGLDNIISKVTINIQGGYIFDKMTVYWKSDSILQYDEDHVYSFPINCFERQQTIYIDDDITELMIVPKVYRGGTYTFDSILVDKYIVN